MKTLIETLDFPSSYNGVFIREKLEKILDELQLDGIVAEWYYTEPIDESKVGKRGWVKKYWGELNLIILPPHETIEENKKKIDQMELLAQKQEAQQRLLENNHSDVDMSEAVSKTSNSKVIPKTKQPLSPESLAEIIDREKLSIRGAAAEIGVSHSTLLRYLKNEMKRYNKASMAKMKAWLEKYTE
ncbi:hypothetical protein [Lysinibacillus endophyticus]|uniref:hypothetical protein n=1 Tax=Ureibacillus endophyticus TaxID=1978490 RepID=UPI00209DE2FC|nr:hypothetical protein [Lysinibacillus endophyticus]MCP1146790.1 hypothetical protein [Lysinibacillus endophyticus]